MTSEPILVAMEVAEAFIQENTSRSWEVTQEIEQASLLIGQHLADVGRAGQWQKIDIEGFYRECGYIPQRELVLLSLSLVALYGWLGSTLLDPIICREVLRQVRRHGPQEPTLLQLARHGEKLLDSAAALESCQACMN